MPCPRCRHESPPQAKFCAECGSSLGQVCARCGVELPAEAKFCPECGTRVGTASPEPRSYTPKHLADKILTSRSALEGERKQLTVLFADVKGSMDLAGELDPEAWHRILDRFFQILADGIHRFEGTINQYTGDGVMALFGAPIAHENHAHRACYASLTLREELRRYSDELRLSQGLNLSVRMGLNSGEVVVGKIGDDLRMDYTAQGPTVGLAARMEQIAQAGTIYVAQPTADLVTGYFQLRDLGATEVKGVAEPVRVYELEGVGRLRTRLDVSRARGLSRFVGRTSEMTVLEGALEQALAGNGQVVGVVGEAGVGKSRLCYEFVERCRARGINVAQAHCVVHGKLIPLLPILELLRDIYGVTERDSEREARRKIAGTLVLLAEDIGEGLPLVLELMGVPEPGRPPLAIDPAVRERRLADFLKRMVRARSEREPALILVDDLHWIDATSDLYLAHFVEAIAGTRTVLLVNFRPEYRAEWMAKSLYQQLPLRPLGAEATAELLDALLGSHPSLDGLPARVLARSGGNPFFTEEIVQALVESGRLVGERGAYRLVEAIERLAIPPTVQTILAARIDRLPEREKSVLHSAAVIGRVVAEPVLRRVVDVGPAELGAALRALTNGEFLYEQALYPVSEYAFKHPLTEEVAYGSQLEDRRRRAHARVASAIAEVYPDKLDELAALLAHHRERAGDAWEAARCHARAARYCGMRDSAGSLRHWREAWSQLAACAPTPERARLMLEAADNILVYGARMGLAPAEAAALLERGRELADEIGDVRARALLSARYAAVILMVGEPPPNLHELLAEARLLADQSDDPSLRLFVRSQEALPVRMRGDPAAALALFQEAFELVGDDPLRGRDLIGYAPYPRLLWSRVELFLDLGDVEAARRDLSRLLELAEELADADPELGIYAQGRAAELARHVDLDGEAMLGHARRAVGVAEQLGTSAFLIYSYTVLAAAHATAGQWDESLVAAERARAQAESKRTALPFESYVLAHVAEAAASVGDHVRAQELADQAVTLAAARGFRRIELYARIAHARVLLRCGDAPSLASAMETLEAALRLREEISAKGLEPLIRSELAELARLRGDAATWRAELSAAHRLCVEMAMKGRAARLAGALAAG